MIWLGLRRKKEKKREEKEREKEGEEEERKDKSQIKISKEKFKLQKKSGHVGNHEVFFNIDELKFKRIVNSFHNHSIKIKKSKTVDILAIAPDETVEAFHIKDKRILGIMWHPERYTKIKNFDQKLIKKFYATNSIISW